MCAFPIRTLLVDPHPVVTDALTRRLQPPGFDVVGVAHTANEARARAGHLQPDLAVVETEAAGCGIRLIENLGEIVPGVTVVSLSSSDDPVRAAHLLRAGARGVLSKRSSVDGLARYLKSALGGRIALGARFRSELVARAIDGCLNADLTAREGEVFDLFGDGLTTREVADLLVLSVKTVETYRASIREKLALPNNNRLIHAATLRREEQRVRAAAF